MIVKQIMKALLILIFLLLENLTYAQSPISADIRQGCVPITVNFECDAPEWAEAFEWNFGNGQTSTLQNPMVLYSDAGSYDVQLTISGNGQSETFLIDDYIESYPLPVPEIIYSGDSLMCAPAIAEFSYIVENEIETASQTWDFGNGYSSQTENTVHIYQNAGFYSPTLSLISNKGCIGFVKADSLLRVYKPEADFTTPDTSSCSGELLCPFQNLSAGQTELNFYWNFGDGSSSEQQNPTHFYENSGEFDLRLITEDSLGCRDTLTKEKYILIDSLFADFSFGADTVCINEPVNFENHSENFDSYFWNFGDGSTSTEYCPTHTYNISGNHLVSLEVSGTCSDVLQKNIYVEKPEPEIFASQNFICSFSDSIVYSCSGSYEHYLWKFGSGKTDSTANPIVYFEEEGFYSDTLFVKTRNGCTAEVIADSIIEVKLPHAYFTPNSFIETNMLEGCAPLTVDFTNKSYYSTDKDSIISYQWIYDNGQTSDSYHLSSTFNSVGMHPVNLRIETAKSCVSIYGASALVGEAQEPDFIPSHSDTICASQAVSFENLSEDINQISEVLWKFGDGRESDKFNPIHVFADTGSMDIELIVYHNGCPAKKTLNDYLYIKGPVLHPAYTVNCEQPLRAEFESGAIDADMVFWDFEADGETDSSGYTSANTFCESGNYTSIINAVNETTQCSFEATKDVTIREIKAKFSREKEFGCAGTKVQLDASLCEDESPFLNDNEFRTYYWQFPDDDYSHFTNDSIFTYTFNKRGDNAIRLIVKDMRDCADTFKLNFKVYQPEPDFQTSSLTGCMPMSVQFQNNTLSDTSIVNYHWDFGNGGQASTSNPETEYTAFGRYSVRLQAENILGCISEKYKPDYIEALRPVPDFAAEDRTVCVGDTVMFETFAEDSITGYEWQFGSFCQSNAEMPTVVFPDSGYYDVSLALTDMQGCDSVQLIRNYIHVQSLPEPDFVSDTTNSNCYPLSVTFENTNPHPHQTESLWFFGDSASAHNQNTTFHTYTEPGEYTVSLELTGSYGCKNRMVKQNFIKVGGPYAEINMPDSVCKYETFAFETFNENNLYSSQWFFGNGNGINEESGEFAYSRSGYHYPILLLSSDSAETCKKIISDSVFVHYLDAGIGGEFSNGFLTSCRNESFRFSDASAYADSLYWNIGANYEASYSNPMYRFPESGIYRIEQIAFNQFACTDTSTVFIKVFPNPKIRCSPDTTVCLGSEIELFAKGANSYEWTPETYLSDCSVAEPNCKPDSSIYYTVKGTDSNGCISYGDIIVKVHEPVEIHLEDTVLIAGDSVYIDAFHPEIAHYRWEPAYAFDNAGSPQVYLKPQEGQEYSLYYSDKYDCFDKVSKVNFDIIYLQTLDVPDAFSPNGDGINDKIYANGAGIKKLTAFKIFNRFGELVFESSERHIGWDGYYKGKLQRPDTYTFTVEAIGVNGDILQKKGFFKLLK